jgi:hypothetical protein
MRIAEAESGLPCKILRLLLIIFSFVWLPVAFPPDSNAAPKAKLIFADQVLGSFKNGQDRVAVIVNLVAPPRALQPPDWNSVQSVRTLHAANQAAEDEILKTLAADEHKVRFRFDNQAGFSPEITEQSERRVHWSALVFWPSIKPDETE